MTRYISIREATEICQAVAAVHGIPLERMLDERRHGPSVEARREAMRIMRDRGASYPMIGKRMQRHHTTVMQALGALGAAAAA